MRKHYLFGVGVFALLLLGSATALVVVNGAYWEGAGALTKSGVYVYGPNLTITYYGQKLNDGYARYHHYSIDCPEINSGKTSTSGCYTSGCSAGKYCSAGISSTSINALKTWLRGTDFSGDGPHNLTLWKYWGSSSYTWTGNITIACSAPSDSWCVSGSGSCVNGTEYADHCFDNLKNCDETFADLDGADCESDTIPEVSIWTNVTETHKFWSIDFNGTVTNGNKPFTYDWDFVIDSADTEDVLFSFNQTGLFNVTFTVTDADGDSDFAYVLINITE